MGILTKIFLISTTRTLAILKSLRVRNIVRHASQPVKHSLKEHQTLCCVIQNKPPSRRKNPRGSTNRTQPVVVKGSLTGHPTTSASALSPCSSLSSPVIHCSFVAGKTETRQRYWRNSLHTEKVVAGAAYIYSCIAVRATIKPDGSGSVLQFRRGLRIFRRFTRPSAPLRNILMLTYA